MKEKNVYIFSHICYIASDFQEIQIYKKNIFI